MKVLLCLSKAVVLFDRPLVSIHKFRFDTKRMNLPSLNILSKDHSKLWEISGTSMLGILGSSVANTRNFGR